MFGLGFTEIIVILVVALIFVGPQELPKLGVKLGKIWRSVSMAKHEFNSQFRTASRNLKDEFSTVRPPEDKGPPS